VNIHIREAKLADLEDVLRVYKDAGLETRGSLSIQTARGIFEKMTTYPSYRVHIAEVDGIICGTFALLIMDNLANGGMPSGIVEDVAVARSFQGQGVGKAMMRFAMEECKRSACYKMTLSCNEMREQAHKFYESLGFTRHGFSDRVGL